MKNEQYGGAVLTSSSGGARVLENCSRSTGTVTSMHEPTRCRVWRRCTIGYVQCYLLQPSLAMQMQLSACMVGQIAARCGSSPARKG